MFVLDQFFGVSGKDYSLNMKDEVSILIKTFKRPDNLKRLLASLVVLNCKLPVLIADDSEEPYGQEMKTLFPRLDIQYYILPFDTGLSGGRNFLLEKVQTPFFLLCDDDFIFDKRSRINWMKEELIANNLDILGGALFEYRPKTKGQSWWYVQQTRLRSRLNIIIPAKTVYTYYGNYSIAGTTCTISQPPYHPPVTSCDFCLNFFIARTAAVKAIGGWKKELKIGEHEHFFIKAKLRGLKVGTTHEAGIIHGNFYDTKNDYGNFRKREAEFKINVLREFNIDKVANYKEVFGFPFEANEE